MTNSQKSKIPTAIIILVIALGIIILAIFLMRGQTTTTGQYPDDIKTAALNCSNTGNKYPFFSYDKSNKKATEINAIFDNDNLRSISLVHTLYYSNPEDAVGSEAFNHADMNESFGAALGHDALNANYSRTDDSMRLSLYATSSDLEQPNALRYFLVDTNETIPHTMSDYSTYYNKLGFDCVQKNQ